MSSPDFPEEHFESGKIMRSGDLLIIYNRAALPNYCFQTGEPTRLAVDVEQIWAPRWTTWLLLLFILPYFAVTPFLRRRVRLHLPISAAAYQKHCRVVRLGFRLLFSGALFMIAGLAFGNFLGITGIILLFAILMGSVGFLLSSRQPLHLDIVSVDENLLVLRGIHPKCLARIPAMDQQLTGGV